MRIVGLTGSIAMGKTTTAAMLRGRGVPVHDADRAVHRLYDGEASAAVEAAFPGVVMGGRVDRGLLAARIRDEPAALSWLEAIVHPLVRSDEARFIEASKAAGHATVALDVPLLLETSGEDRVDWIVVVTAPERVQRDRVMARPGMTAEKLSAILARQIPDRDKRARAHFLIETGRGRPDAERQVDALLRALSGCT